jgi:PAS domain S-box-containing protein
MDKPGNAKALVELNKKLKAQATIIREERARASALIASIGEGLIATNEVGKIIQVNQAALDILDYKRKDLIDSWMPQQIIAVHEDDSPIKSIDRPIMKVFLTGKAVTEILYYRRSDGTKIPVYITASPIFLRGRPIGAIEIFRDITKDIEADKLKSEFISLASHQLRTPLSSINIYSHMLKEEYAGRLSRSQVKLLDVVLSATSRMNSLINTLLNITRVEGTSRSY